MSNLSSHVVVFTGLILQLCSCGSFGLNRQCLCVIADYGKRKWIIINDWKYVVSDLQTCASITSSQSHWMYVRSVCYSVTNKQPTKCVTLVSTYVSGFMHLGIRGTHKGKLYICLVSFWTNCSMCRKLKPNVLSNKNLLSKSDSPSAAETLPTSVAVKTSINVFAVFGCRAGFGQCVSSYCCTHTHTHTVVRALCTYRFRCFLVSLY